MPAPSPQTFGHLSSWPRSASFIFARDCSFSIRAGVRYFDTLKNGRHRARAEMAFNGHLAAAYQDLSTIIEYLSTYQASLLWCLGHVTLCVARPEKPLSRVRRTNE